MYWVLFLCVGKVGVFCLWVFLSFVRMMLFCGFGGCVSVGSSLM